MMAEGEFPRPVKISKGAVAWRESEVVEWMDTRDVAEPGAAIQ